MSSKLLSRTKVELACLQSNIYFESASIAPEMRTELDIYVFIRMQSPEKKDLGLSRQNDIHCNTDQSQICCKNIKTKQIVRLEIKKICLKSL